MAKKIILICLGVLISLLGLYLIAPKLWYFPNGRYITTFLASATNWSIDADTIYRPYETDFDSDGKRDLAKGRCVCLTGDHPQLATFRATDDSFYSCKHVERLGCKSYEFRPEKSFFRFMFTGERKNSKHLVFVTDEQVFHLNFQGRELLFNVDPLSKSPFYPIVILDRVVSGFIQPLAGAFFMGFIGIVWLLFMTIFPVGPIVILLLVLLFIWKKLGNKSKTDKPLN